eukprot:PLAT12464.12.p1 GENE.PLAT12464.12~~PLAT12464.12.p1  ORF type:complete len:725 (+),score=350.68 PLAT12464.12:151-2325(+)
MELDALRRKNDETKLQIKTMQGELEDAIAEIQLHEKEELAVQLQLDEAVEALQQFDYIEKNDLVPRAVVEAKEAEVAEVARRLEEYRKLEHNLKLRYDRDQQRFESLRGELEETEMEIKLLSEDKKETLDRCYTPRPDWEEVFAAVPGLEQWDREATAEEQRKKEEEAAAAASARAELAERKLVEEGSTAPLSPARRAVGHAADEEGSADGSSRSIPVPTLEERIAATIEPLPSPSRSNRLVRELIRRAEQLKVEEAVAEELESTKTELKRVTEELATAKARLEEAAPEVAPKLTEKTTPGDSGEAQFMGLGTGAHVPKYLRFNGMIRNRNISRADLLSLVRQIWRDKLSKEGTLGFHVPLSEFFYEYLKNKFGIQTIIAEWGYNIIYGLEKYVADPDLELFLLCLTGALSETVYEDQLEMSISLSELCSRLESLTARRRSHEAGMIRKEDLLLSLRGFFPLKTTAQLDAIRRELSRSSRGGDVKYALLFSDDTTGPQTAFMREVRKQHLREIKDFLVALDRSLQTRDRDRSGKVMIIDLREVFMELDSHLNRSQVTEYLCRGMACEESDIRWDAHVDMEDFLKRVKMGLVKPSRNWDPKAGPAMSADRGRRGKRKRRARAKGTMARSRSRRSKKAASKAAGDGEASAKPDAAAAAIAAVAAATEAAATASAAGSLAVTSDDSLAEGSASLLEGSLMDSVLDDSLVEEGDDDSDDDGSPLPPSS